MSKYFTRDTLNEMLASSKRVYAEREAMKRKYDIDLLDTDALSSLSIFEIVSQYDSAYNICFDRNGEDASSNDTLIEQKTNQVDPNPFTKKINKIRKGYGQDASWAFHVGGDIEHDRYIFVARSKVDLKILRVYDISNAKNRKIVVNELNSKRENWHKKGFQKNDIIAISEKTILEKCKFISPKLIDGCNVFTD
jgi:hypothetical protein